MSSEVSFHLDPPLASFTVVSQSGKASTLDRRQETGFCWLQSSFPLRFGKTSLRTLISVSTQRPPFTRAGPVVWSTSDWAVGGPVTAANLSVAAAGV